MNKRIKELAHKCGFKEYQGDDGADDESLTKFAELIIQECAQVAVEVDGDSRARKCVLEHFGIN